MEKKKADPHFAQCRRRGKTGGDGSGPWEAW
jgi:hypothetical protein